MPAMRAKVNKEKKKRIRKKCKHGKSNCRLCKPDNFCFDVGHGSSKDGRYIYDCIVCKPRSFCNQHGRHKSKCKRRRSNCEFGSPRPEISNEVEEGEKVLMYDGTIRPMKELQVGDLVMGDDSKQRRVLEIHSGTDALYKITNLKGKSYTVNSSHILSLVYNRKKFIRARPGRNQYEVNWFNKDKVQINSKTFSYKNKDKQKARREARVFLDALQDDRKVDIPIKDYLKLSKTLRENLKSYQVPIDFSEKSLPIPPYMIGYWLGDGTAANSYITSQDSTVLRYFAKNLPDYNLFLDLVAAKGYHYRISSGYGQKGNVFLQTLKDLDLIYNKHIPMIYKCNSRKNRLELLAGFLDADGHKAREINQFILYQSIDHEKLLDDIIYLANSLGFSATKRNVKPTLTLKGKERKGFISCISGEGIETIPTKIPRKQARPRESIKDVLTSQIKVEEVGHGEFVDIKVDGNHRYVLDNFIVTHDNSGLIDRSISSDTSCVEEARLFQQFLLQIA